MDFVSLIAPFIETDEPGRILLEYVKKTSRSDERSFEDQMKYTTLYIQIAMFLHGMRTETLKTTKMSFVVKEGEVYCQTDCYWYDVVYQCNKLAHQTIEKIKSDCGGTFNSAEVTRATLIRCTETLKNVIGLLSVVGKLSMKQCIHIERQMPGNCSLFRSRFLTIRIVACWCSAVFWAFHNKPTLKGLKLAATRFYTCEKLIQSNQLEYNIHTELAKDSELNRHVALALYYISNAQLSDAVVEYKLAITLGYPISDEIKQHLRDSELLDAEASRPLTLELERDSMLTGPAPSAQLSLNLTARPRSLNDVADL